MEYIQVFTAAAIRDIYRMIMSHPLVASTVHIRVLNTTPHHADNYTLNSSKARIQHAWTWDGLPNRAPALVTKFETHINCTHCGIFRP